nr:hypothetical protein CFP56_29392 [Quercus suber]
MDPFNPFNPNIIYPNSNYSIQPIPKKKTSPHLRRFWVSFHFHPFSRPPITASAASKLRTHQNSSKLQQISELFAGIFTLSLSGHSSAHRSRGQW